MKSYDFLFWAYNVVWASLAVFLLLLFRRLGRTTRRLERLERELKERG
jgi:CcmD family protein